jgi:hypothetical protein
LAQSHRILSHAAYAGSSSAHIEGGKGQTPKVVHFQMRGNPLEK